MRLATTRSKSIIIFDSRLHRERDMLYASYIARVHSKAPTTLTSQEFGTLFYAAQGYTARETGSVMQLSAYTIKQYRKNLLEKMNVRNMTHAVALGKDLGII
jgi:DNA-binding CsgD family transcriptional regulator